MQRAIAAIRTTRPYSLLWFVTVPAVTMGVWLEGNALDLARLAAMVGALVCTDAGLTTWNDIADTETDAASSELHRSKRPLQTGALTLPWAVSQVLLLEACALALAFILAPLFAALLLPLFGYAWLYSWPRDRDTSSGRITQVINFLMWPYIYQLCLLIVWPCIYIAVALVLHADPAPGWLYVAGNVLFVGLAMTLAKDLRDIENDAQVDKLTGAVALGVARTTGLSLGGFGAGAVAWICASLSSSADNPGLTGSLLIVLSLWLGRAALLAQSLQREYTKQAAKDLQMGATRVFLTVNLIFIAGL